MTALAAVTAVAVAVVAMALLGHGRTGTTAAPRSGSSGAKGLQGLPTTIFIDPAGRVVYVHHGEYDTLAALEHDIATCLQQPHVQASPR